MSSSGFSSRSTNVTARPWVERAVGILDADRGGRDTGGREDACHGVEAAVLHELLDLAMETGERVTLGRDEVGPGRDRDPERVGARDESTSEVGVAPLREAAVRVLSQHAVRPRVESEGGIQKSSRRLAIS